MGGAMPSSPVKYSRGLVSSRRASHSDGSGDGENRSQVMMGRISHHSRQVGGVPAQAGSQPVI